MKKLLLGFIFLLISGNVIAQSDARLIALNPQAGASSIYQFSFITADTMHSEAVFEIVFPGTIDISRVKIAGSSTINGGFSVSVSTDTVIVNRSGNGKAIEPGQSVSIEIATVKNPDALSEELRAQARIRAAAVSTGQFIDIPIIFSRPENE